MLRKDGSELKSTKITIPAGGTKEITYTARLRPSELGKEVKNTAGIYSAETGGYKYAEASSSTNAKKTIRIASSTGVADKYNVILVLDKSWSELGELGDIKNAAQGLVNELEDTDLKRKNINKTYIAFANSAERLTSLNYYLPSITGGTNYNAALIEANRVAKTGEKNIVVFMSDGCPTSTIAPSSGEIDEWLKKKINKEASGKKFFEKLIETTLKPIRWVYDNIIAGFINQVTGGWLELVWKGEDSYGFNLLVVPGHTFNDFTYDFFKDWTEKSSVAKIEWDKIRNQVSKLKNEKNVEKFYTIYYCSKLDSKDAEYGLKKMATDESYYYLAKNITELKQRFKEIGKNMIPEATAETKESYMTNTIILDSGIKQIKINDTEIDVNTYVKDIGGGKCELDISNWLGDDIEIIY